MSLIKTNTVLNQAEKISMTIQSLVLYFEVNIVLVMINLKQLLRSHTLFAGQQSVSLLLKSHVNVHIASIHEGKKPFRCEICDQHFTQKGHIDKHITSAVCKK